MIETIPDSVTWEKGEITYGYYLSARRRTMGITVHSDLSVRVRAPLRTGRDAIQRYVLAHAGWITRTQERLALRLPPEPPNYTSGEFHYYTGKRYRLEITQGSKDAVACVADTLLVTSRGEPTGEKVRKVLDGWYRSRAEILFHERLAVCHARVAHEQIPLPALRIKRMRSRWGSYSPKGVSLNLLLVMTPIECLDYVILHELCHHKVRGHGRRLWALMKRLMPEYMERRRQLNEHGAVLHLSSS